VARITQPKGIAATLRVILRMLVTFGSRLNESGKKIATQISDGRCSSATVRARILIFQDRQNAERKLTQVT